MKSPAFQFYPKDWLSSRSVRLMTDQQRGWYIQLLCEAWESEEQGTLPNDQELLKKLAGASNPIATLWNDVINCFISNGGILVHERLTSEKAKQEEYKKHQSEAGIKGAQKRWKKRLKATLKQPNGDPNGVAILSPMANYSSSSSSSIASSYNKEEESHIKKNGSSVKNVSNSKKKEFTDLWCQKYQETFGVKYKFEGAKDGVASDSLIALGISNDEIISVAAAAWANPQGFWSKQAATIAGFSSKFNNIRMENGNVTTKKVSLKDDPFWNK